MQKFKDNANHSWEIALTIGAAIKVKDRLGVDLLQPEVGDPPLLTRLGTDEMLLAQVIATLLESQFEENKVDESYIYDCFDASTFARAHEAFYKELIDFFQSRGRKDRATAVEKQTKMIEAGIKAASAKLNEIDVDKVVSEALEQATPKSKTN